MKQFLILIITAAAIILSACSQDADVTSTGVDIPPVLRKPTRPAATTQPPTTQPPTAPPTQPSTQQRTEPSEPLSTQPATQPEPENEPVSITISAAGDCVLGNTTQDYYHPQRFVGTFLANNRDYGYFFKNVLNIFEKDDITIVNLEAPLTTAEIEAEKEWRFKGLPEFHNILTEGNVDIVNFANNHAHDFLQQGYDDTIKNLNEGGVPYVEDGKSTVLIKKGIRIGFVSFCFNFNAFSEVKRIRDSVDLLIFSMHSGDEKVYFPASRQADAARTAIDNGADLVLGHHPHVIQGISEYKGKRIVYSLANFSYGCSILPADMDTYIYQQTFTFVDGKLTDTIDSEIIPCSVSSKNGINDYRPTPLKDKELDRFIEKFNAISDVTLTLKDGKLRQSFDPKGAIYKNFAEKLNPATEPPAA